MRYTFHYDGSRQGVGRFWGPNPVSRGGLLIAGRMNLPLGRLPGDIIYRSKHTTFYFPLVTSIILSVVLSVVLYLVSRFSAK